MSPQCLPLTVREQIGFEDFQDGSRCGHLGYLNGTILAIWISLVLWWLPASFSSIQFTVWEDMLFEDIQDGRHGSHLGYRKGIILAILNLHVALMPPIKFRFNLTYGSGADVVSRFSRWPPWRPSWTAERNDFSNSEPLCHSDASHQV